MSDFAKERVEICKACPYNEDDDCIICGCHLPTKVLDPSESCPLSPGAKWGPFVEQPVEIKKEAAPQVVIPPRPPPCKTCTKYGR